jgi:cysteine-rich repeat protein
VSEVCDDGLDDGMGCATGCAAVASHYTCTHFLGGESVCAGDGKLQGAEECDDANMIPDDGCSLTMTKEVGWTCSGEPATCAGVVSDGLI